MDNNHYVARVAQAVDLKRMVIALLMSSLALNALFGWGLVQLATAQNLNVKVSVPPTLEKSFWVTRDQASQEWIEQMGLFVTQLMLNVTPASVQYQGRMVLDMVSPQAHGAIKKQIDVNALRIQRSSISTFFTPRETIFDKENPRRVALKGDLTTVLSDKTVSKRQVIYVVAFGFESGTQRLTQAFESTATDPLGLAPITTPETAE